MAHHITETVLLQVHHDISGVLDYSRAVALVILDLSAAFDNIDQCQPLYMLNAEFGVHAQALSWLETYLEARTQIVKIGDAISEPIPLTCGGSKDQCQGRYYSQYNIPFQCHGLYASMMLCITIMLTILSCMLHTTPNVLGDMQRAVKQLEYCIAEIRG